MAAILVQDKQSVETLTCGSDRRYEFSSTDGWTFALDIEIETGVGQVEGSKSFGVSRRRD